MKFFHERAGAIVDGLARDGAVVGVHDAVDEAEAHPVGNEFGLGSDDVFEKGEIGIGCVGGFGVVALDGVVGEDAKGFDIVTGVEVLKGANSNVAGGDASEDSAHDMAFLAIDGFAGGDGGEGSRCWNTEGVHRFADDVFAQDGTEGGFAVAATGEVSRAGTFQLDVAGTLGGGDFA